MVTPFFSSFVNRYKLNKTLRFELIPQGETLQHIESLALLTQDQQRADEYKEIKGTIDAFHRDFIDRAMYRLQAEAHTDINVLSANEISKIFTHKDIELFYNIYNEYKKDRKIHEKTYKAALERLRKKFVARSFSSSELKKLFSKELITQYLPAFIKEKGNEDLFYTKNFDKFTTFFSGFHENRKNMYTNEEKSTSVGYRIINENLPKFMDNKDIYDNYHDVLQNIIQTCTQEEHNFFKQHNITTIFTIEGYADCFSQKGISAYNALLGGTVEENGHKNTGLNMLINLYNQQCKDKKHRIPLFKYLYKQILSDRKALSFLPKSFSQTDEMYSAIKTFYSDNIITTSNPVAKETGNVISDLELLFQHLQKQGLDEKFNTQYIYIDKASISSLSMQIFSRYSVISESLEHFYTTDSQFSYAAEKLRSNTEKKRETLLKKKDDFIQKAYHSLDTLQKAIDAYAIVVDDEKIKLQAQQRLIDFFALHFHVKETEKTFSHLAFLKARYSTIQGELERDHDSNYKPSDATVTSIKLFLDSIMNIVHFVKMLTIKRKDLNTFEVDTSFYGPLEALYEEIAQCTQLYDKVRNFITQKPYSTEKIKLTFNEPTLASGWDENKETDNKCVLLQKDGTMYLAITNKKYMKKGEEIALYSNQSWQNYKCQQDCYAKMTYKFFPDVTKMIPKCSTQLKEAQKHFATSGEDKFVISTDKFARPFIIPREIFELNNVPEGVIKQFQKGYLKETGDVTGYTDAVQKWISFCIDFVKSYASTHSYDLSSLKQLHEYPDVDSFYKDLNKLLYSVDFTKKIPSGYITQLVKDNKIFLFKIHNKDFNAGSQGTPNLHTLYWKALFSQENMQNTVLKLDGDAEIFYRTQSISQDTIVYHKAGETLLNKTTDDGQSIPDAIYTKLYKIFSGAEEITNLSVEEKYYYDRAVTKKATHCITKDRRFTQAKFLFHVPLTLNFKAQGLNKLNDEVLEKLKNNPNINVIGIDRGERHLLYYTIVNQKGEILEQSSLNCMTEQRHTGEVRTVDYHSKLDTREKERDHARKNWQNINKIADLKQGYLSHVVHQLSTLIEKYNAIVVLEDLNFGFKRGRFKVEKQVYQNFEKALITKLNRLCFKKRDPSSLGGILNAYQLTEAFESFKKMGKQNGILFYVPAHHTSKIDPVTGFVDRVRPKYQNKEQAQAFFAKFDSIHYDQTNRCFDFTFDESHFAPTPSKLWTIKTWGDCRYRWNPKANNNKGGTEAVDVSREIALLLQSANITYEQGHNIKGALETSDNIPLLRGLIYLLRLVLHMRYSYHNEDFILSPVTVQNGKVFDTRKVTDALPCDADANGAYNIARKGLLILERLQTEEAYPLVLSNQTWFDYVQRDDIVEQQSEKL